jgi:hypothetical protein
MSGPSSNSLSAGAFTVTVAGEPRFVETIRLLTHKTAEADGCSTRDADRMAEAVQCVVGALLTPSAANGGPALDVRFEPSAGVLQVEIGVPGAGGSSSRSVEQVLAQRGVLGSLRALVPDVQFIRRGAVELCRFRCPRRSADR